MDSPGGWTSPKHVVAPCARLCVVLMAILACLGCGTVKSQRAEASGSHSRSAAEGQSDSEAAKAEQARAARARAGAMECALQTATAALQKMEGEPKKLGALDYLQPGQPKLIALIRAVQEEVSAVDTTGCPQEFRDAYVEFTHRFDDFVNATAQYRGWRGIKLGLLTPWRIFEIDEKTDEASKPATAAWQKLERIAVAGGATLSK